MKATVLGLAVLIAVTAAPQNTPPGAAPVIVLDTAKGTLELEMYPEEAPKTVARLVELVQQGFYDGQRFHRAEPGFLIQVGDPTSRDLSREEWWGRRGAGKPIGVSEITKKRRHERGAVGMAYPGSDPRTADSQFYVLLAAHPELDAKYTVFGRVIEGMEVADRIVRGDVLRKAYLKAGS